MPLYEYECAACHTHIEVLQTFAEPPLEECAHCHQPQLKRLISATHFQLKGTGWYVTDFRNPSAQPKADAPSDQPSNDQSAKPKDTSSEEAKKPGQTTTPLPVTPKE
ncbi:MAG: hypothetical protein A3F41_04950 [Coxiella sp. RIFCSPHIGHO2_12_FULL_44_14]|nr:MAG: hypothetical protein A3F41_04950 [Coxiella sp. RIFCSPHIGHO2_12_FULL_44_14]